MPPERRLPHPIKTALVKRKPASDGSTKEPIMCSTLTFGRLRPQDCLRQREGNTVCTALTRSTCAEPRSSARPGSGRTGRNGSLGGGNSGGVRIGSMTPMVRRKRKISACTMRWRRSTNTATRLDKRNQCSFVEWATSAIRSGSRVMSAASHGKAIAESYRPDLRRRLRKREVRKTGLYAQVVSQAKRRHPRWKLIGCAK